MPEPTRRITPAEVLAAYAATGLQPVRQTFGDEECGCPLIAMHKSSKVGGTPKEWMEREVGMEYALGFISAVDFGKRELDLATGRYREGMEDGLAVRAELWPETKETGDE